MFTSNHFIWLAACAAAIVGGAVMAVRRGMTARTAGRIMSAIAIVSEFSKMMTHLLPSPLGGMALDPAALPFHLCSMQIFIVFYITFAKDSPMRDRVISFSVPAALLGGTMALLIPVDGVDFLDPLAWQSFGYHAGLVWLAVYFITSRQVNLGLRAYGRNLLILLGLAVTAIYINGAFFSYGTNFMFVTRPPLEDLPILNLDHGWYGYFANLGAVAFVLMTALHLPFLIAERKKK